MQKFKQIKSKVDGSVTKMNITSVMDTSNTGKHYKVGSARINHDKKTIAGIATSNLTNGINCNCQSIFRGTAKNALILPYFSDRYLKEDRDVLFEIAEYFELLIGRMGWHYVIYLKRRQPDISKDLQLIYVLLRYILSPSGFTARKIWDEIKRFMKEPEVKTPLEAIYLGHVFAKTMTNPKYYTPSRGFGQFSFYYKGQSSVTFRCSSSKLIFSKEDTLRYLRNGNAQVCFIFNTNNYAINPNKAKAVIREKYGDDGILMSKLENLTKKGDWRKVLELNRTSGLAE